MIEVVSPGNKPSAAEFHALLDKLTAFLRQGVHLLVVDLFPPTRRDPRGIHQAIWNNFIEDEADEFRLPPDSDRVLASYSAGTEIAAYAETVAVGDALPDMPVFLTPDFYVPAPLDRSYHGAWTRFPSTLKGLLERVGEQ